MMNAEERKHALSPITESILTLVDAHKTGTIVVRGKELSNAPKRMRESLGKPEHRETAERYAKAWIDLIEGSSESPEEDRRVVLDIAKLAALTLMAKLANNPRLGIRDGAPHPETALEALREIEAELDGHTIGPWGIRPKQEVVQ